MGEKKPATKVCKHCKTEIPHGAKVCPNCRKKQGGILKWIVIVIVVIGIIGVAAGGGDDNKPTKVADGKSKADSSSTDDSSAEKADDTEDSEEETVFKLGETAELNGVQVTLTDYKEKKGSEFNMPTDGNVFALAEFEIVNNSDRELSISSVLSFEAYADDYALNDSLEALLEKDGNQLDGTIAVGKRLKGWIGYEIPKDYKNLEIHFTDNVWSDNKFIFLIEN